MSSSVKVQLQLVKKTVGVNFIFNHTADVVQKSMMTVDIDVIYYRTYTGYWIRK